MRPFLFGILLSNFLKIARKFMHFSLKIDKNHAYFTVFFFKAHKNENK